MIDSENDDWTYFKQKIKTGKEDDTIKIILKDWNGKLTYEKDFEFALKSLHSRFLEINNEQFFEGIQAMVYPVTDYLDNEETYNKIILDIFTARFVKFLSSHSSPYRK
jgi:hypothetical protein